MQRWKMPLGFRAFYALNTLIGVAVNVRSYSKLYPVKSVTPDLLKILQCAYTFIYLLYVPMNI